MSANEFTKSEALRRLRVLAAEGRIQCRGKSNWRVEVGYRTVPVAQEEPDKATAIHPDDDLDWHAPLSEAADDPQVRAHGAVVHLYFSSPGINGELEDTLHGWMGTPDREPVMF